MSSNPYYSTNYTPEQHQSLVNFIISALDAPIDPTIVSKHYSNDRNIATEIQAYAKISGKDWTYYVKNLEIIIGRDTESKFDILPSISDNNNNNNNKDHIDIDLGPAKVVSRKHALIKYNIQLGCWELHVIGRNGAKVNFHRIHGNPATPVPLRSGTILDIGGTQMIFILPDQVPILSESALEHMMPKLITLFGVEPNTNNPLINDLIKNSSFAMQEKERLKFEQTLQQNTNNITNATTTTTNNNINKQGNNSNNQEFRIFKMYSSIQSANNVGNSMNPNPSSTITNNNNTTNNNNNNNNNNSYNQFMNTGIQSNGNTPVYNELSGPTTIVNGDYSYNVVSQSSSEANMKRITALTQSGFPYAMDYATDLSLDENRTVKPPHSYATMITQAILSSKDGVISLSDIYRFISTNYSYYRYAKTGWQNSIRHNLSLNKAFEKVPRKPNEPGKGMKWRVSESFQKDFLNAWYTGNLSKIKRGSSVFRQLQMHMAKYNKLPGRDEEGNLVSNDDPVPPSNNNNNNNTHHSHQHHHQPPPPPQQQQPQSSLPAQQNNTVGVSQNNLNNQQHIMQLNFNNGNINNNTMKQEITNVKINQPPQFNNNNTASNNEMNNDQNVGFTPIPPPSSTSQSMTQQQQQQENSNIVPLPKIVTTTTTTTTNNNNENRQHSVASSTSTHSQGTNVDGRRDSKNGSISGSMINTHHQSNSNSSNSSNNTTGPTTAGTTISSNTNKLDPTISNGYDSLLRSPTKAFHITAMEAYTPERGSTINQQMTKSPEQENNHGVTILNGITNTNPSNNNTLNTKKQGNLNSNKSSPGVWNLLQFSSAANTPAIPSMNSKEDNELDVGATTTTATTASSPSGITTTNDGKINDNNTATTPISATSATDQKRNLILDTENAKISTVDN